jgi:hypothetical protein
MQRKTQVLLSAIVILALGVVLFAVIQIQRNPKDKIEQNQPAGQQTSSKLQSAYPAPKSVVNKGVAYPPPSNFTALATPTEMTLKVAASPTFDIRSSGAVNVQRTSLEDAKAAFDEKKAVFLDVRSAESYARNHIPGAISIPETQIMERLKELDPAQWIIAYCS